MDWIGLGQQKMDPCPTLIQMLSDAQLISHSSYRGYSPPPQKKTFDTPPAPSHTEGVESFYN